MLHTVRDRLPIEIAAHLSAQLPMLVRGIYREAYKPAGKSERIRDPDEFVAPSHGSRTTCRRLLRSIRAMRSAPCSPCWNGTSTRANTTR